MRHVPDSPHRKEFVGFLNTTGSKASLLIALDELHDAPTFIGEDLQHQCLGEGILLLHEQFLYVDSDTMIRARPGQSVDTIVLLVQRTVSVTLFVALALPFRHGREEV
eukprot:1863916-Rhodomonas_salina.1